MAGGVTVKFAILGRSHIVALKNAVEEGKVGAGNHALTFLGAQSSVFRSSLYLDDGILCATDKAARMFQRTGGIDHLDPRTYDAVVIYGTFFHMQTFFSSLIRASVDDDGPLCLSSGFLQEAAGVWLGKQVTLDYLRSFRMRAPSVPVVLAMEPFFSERYEAELPKAVTVTPEQRDSILATFAETIKSAGGLPYFQPISTTTKTIYSKDEYCHGSQRLAGGKQSADDVTHLNSSYGAIALRGILEQIERHV
jgi:hypothetical protein